MLFTCRPKSMQQRMRLSKRGYLVPPTVARLLPVAFTQLNEKRSELRKSEIKNCNCAAPVGRGRRECGHVLRPLREMRCHLYFSSSERQLEKMQAKGCSKNGTKQTKNAKQKLKAQKLQRGSGSWATGQQDSWNESRSWWPRTTNQWPCCSVHCTVHSRAGCTLLGHRPWNWIGCRSRREMGDGR